MRWRFGVALALLSVACGARAPEVRPAHRAAGRAGPASTGKPPALVPAAKRAPVDDVIARALARVARLRELPATGAVKGELVSREEMIRLVKLELHDEIPPDVLAEQTEELYALGTVPASFDFEQSVLSLMTAQLAGFYQPKTKTMVLGNDLHGAERQATLDHELVHALQDQHYDLEGKLAYRPDASDEQGALHALAEGDATSAMLDAMLVAQGRRATDIPDAMLRVEVTGSIEMAPSTADIPDIIKRSLVAPYVDGTIFVHWVRRRGGWAALDAVWRNPPTTTEQLLHPDKALAHEPAEIVSVPPAAAGGPDHVVYHDVIGEEALRILFEGWMPERTAVVAASDWGGDRLAMFNGANRHALAWHLRFDTPAAARRAFEAFARGALGGHDVSAATARRESRRGLVCRERAGAGPFAVTFRGRDIGLVAGPYVRAQAGPVSAGSCKDSERWAKAVLGS